MTEKEQEINLIIKYFISLRDEIHIRIKEHTQLVWIKIISLGVIIYYGIIENKFPTGSRFSYFIWIIPLAAIIFDMLIAGNLKDINNLGYYIKKYIETEFKERINTKPLKPKLEKNTFLDLIMHPISSLIELVSKEKPDSDTMELKSTFFWEETAAQSKLKYHCYTAEDVLGIWLFTLASFLFSLLFRLESNHNSLNLVDTILCIFCFIGIIYALMYLIRSITMKRMF